jgi:hypothetical protein
MNDQGFPNEMYKSLFYLPSQNSPARSISVSLSILLLTISKNNPTAILVADPGIRELGECWQMAGLAMLGMSMGRKVVSNRVILTMCGF